MADRAPPDDREGSRRQLSGAWNLAFTAGFTLLGAMAFGYYGGRYLDGLAGTEPWLSLVGFMLGVTAGFRVLIRDVLRPGKGPNPNRESQDRDPDQDGERSGGPDCG